MMYHAPAAGRRGLCALAVLAVSISGGARAQTPPTLCDASAQSCTAHDTDGDGVLEAFPAWIEQPVTVTLPGGCVDDGCVGSTFTHDLPNGARLAAPITHSS